MLSYSEAVKTMFKRQHAGWPTLKSGNADKGKSQENLSHAAERRGTHNTLPLCVSAVPGMPQKSSSYAPISVPIWRAKAVPCKQCAYDCYLEPSYFNNLYSRPISPTPVSREG